MPSSCMVCAKLESGIASPPGLRRVGILMLITPGLEIWDGPDVEWMKGMIGPISEGSIRGAECVLGDSNVGFLFLLVSSLFKNSLIHGFFVNGVFLALGENLIGNVRIDFY